MKYLLIASAEMGIKRMCQLKADISAEVSLRAVAFSAGAQEQLDLSGIESAQIVDYADRPDEFDLTRESVAELNDIARRWVRGRTISQWLKYEDAPLWPFISPNLYADINCLLKNLTIINKILECEQPDVLVCLDTRHLAPWFQYLRGISKEAVVVERLAQQMCAHHGIRCIHIPPPVRLRIRHHLASCIGIVISSLRCGVWLMMLAAILRKGLAILSGVRGHRAKSGTKSVLLFSHRKYWRREYNPFTGRISSTDTSIYPVAHELLKIPGYSAKCIDGNYGFVGGIGSLVDKLFADKHLRWEPFDLWYTVGAILKGRRAARNCRQMLETGDDLAAVFELRGVQLGNLFLPRLKFLLQDYIWKSAIWIEAGRRMVDSENPDLVILTYETGTLSRAIINACHERGIPSLGVQHGAFSASTDDYMRTPDTHIARYVPDKTAVWGERFRRLMVEESAYLESEVVVTGNPRMDFLVGAQSLLDKNVVYDKYGLNTDRKIVLVAPTETIGRARHLAKDRFFEGVVAAKRQLPDYQWVCKLKPGAESKEYYRSLMASHGERDIILTEEDLYSFLVAADVVVTPPSSIALEAIIIGKPVVYVAFPDAEDYFPHLTEKGVVRTIHAVGQMPAAIVDATLASGTDPDRAAISSLIEDENYQPDGAASARIVAVIEDLVDGSSPRSDIHTEMTR